VFPIVAGILTFLFSRWQMKVKEQELLLAVSYFIRGAVFLSYAFMGSFAQLIFTQILWGIGAALGTPAFDATYSAHTSREGSIAEWGQWEGMASMATGLAALASGIIIESVGYTWLFASMSAVSVFLGIYIWRLPRELL
jgi:predicted MFS family arabinose efflux permease